MGPSECAAWIPRRQARWKPAASHEWWWAPREPAEHVVSFPGRRFSPEKERQRRPERGAAEQRRWPGPPRHAPILRRQFFPLERREEFQLPFLRRREGRLPPRSLSPLLLWRLCHFLTPVFLRWPEEMPGPGCANRIVGHRNQLRYVQNVLLLLSVRLSN